MTCVGWYVAYPLSLSHVDEMMQERGVFVDHSTVHRWAIKVLPVLAALFRKRKRPAGSSWRMDETYIKAAFLGHTSITRRNQIWRVRIMITI
jgi:transposase-like protein